MKWRNQPPHHTVQILKLPLPIRHLTNHCTQCCPLQEGYKINEVTKSRIVSFCYEPKSSYHRTDCCRNWSSSGSCCPSTNALNKLPQRQRHQLSILLWLHHVPAQVRHTTSTFNKIASSFIICYIVLTSNVIYRFCHSKIFWVCHRTDPRCSQKPWNGTDASGWFAGFNGYQTGKSNTLPLGLALSAPQVWMQFLTSLWGQ